MPIKMKVIPHHIHMEVIPRRVNMAINPAIIVYPEGFHTYNGDYEVIPSAREDKTLKTANTVLESDILVHKIPYYEVDNASGGTTIYIGADDEIEVSERR